MQLFMLFVSLLLLLLWCVCVGGVCVLVFLSALESRPEMSESHSCIIFFYFFFQYHGWIIPPDCALWCIFQDVEMDSMLISRVSKGFGGRPANIWGNLHFVKFSMKMSQRNGTIFYSSAPSMQRHRFISECLCT